mmetsp:Transcript_25204/g.45618  ORF Transcript_25204/g.45618 Transcript_25204/m.45618 type:complete len:118 (-) Transcript_25204:260-613(-)
MMYFVLFTIVLLILNAHAFSPSANIHAIRHTGWVVASVSSSSTSLNMIFGGKPKQTDSKKNAPKDETKKKKKSPFVMLFGKPQYDWTKGEPMTDRSKMGHVWYTNPNSASTKDSKKK